MYVRSVRIRIGTGKQQNRSGTTSTYEIHTYIDTHYKSSETLY